MEWLSIVPPLLAVSLALLTRRVVSSLVLAVIVGGFLVEKRFLSGVLGGPLVVWKSATDSTNLLILAFVFLVMIMIAVMIVSGGLHVVAERIARLARTSRSTQLAAALMGFAIFIDDYANTMIVGSTMRPMTDRARVSREKLAFLVDATSAPIAGLAIVSTWIGYEVGLFGKQAESLGLNMTGYAMFFDALGFRFYCIMMVFFVLFNVLSRRDYGGMLRAERRAHETGQVAAPDAVPMTSRSFENVSPDPNARASLFTAVLPVAALFIYLFAAMWVDGAGEGKDPLSWVAWRDAISGSENGILILAQAGAVGLAFALGVGKLMARASSRVILSGMWSGLRAGVLPAAVLILAWSLKGICDQMGTSTFLVGVLGDRIPAMALPLLVFLLAGLVAFATGTSWGTMAILIPTAVPLAFAMDGSAYGLLTVITLAAVLDGAIMGDHCSPISDTTVLSSIASSCDHIHHVRTQLPYSLTVGVMAGVLGYLPAALGASPWISYGLAAVTLALIFTVVGRSPESIPSEQ